MKTKDFLKQHSACKDGAKWALSIGGDMADVWNAMIDQGKHDWLIWTATKPGVFPDPVLRKMACRFIRETPLADGRMVWDLLKKEKSRKAVEVAEAYADGKAAYEELEDAYAAARDAAARDAASYEAADDDAAYDAAYAAARAAAAFASSAAHTAAREAARAAASYEAADDDAAFAAAYAAAAARDAANADAKAAQAQMIADMGNPFKEREKQ